MARELSNSTHTERRHGTLPSFFTPARVVRIFAVAAQLVPYVPPRLGYVLCEILGTTVGPHLPVWQQVLANLQVVMADARNGERRAAACRVMIGLFKNYYDLFRFPALSPEQLKQTVVAEGMEHLRRALEAKRGLIVVSPHCGNYTAAVAPLMLHLGTPALMVVEQMPEPRIHQTINRLRQLQGLEVLPLGPTIGRAVLRALRNNRPVVLAGDRAIAENTLTVSFFGRPTPIPSGPATLALRTGAPLVTCLIHRRSDHRSWTHFDPPLVFERTGEHQQDVYNATQKIATIMETYIRRDPSQWLVADPVWDDA